MAGKTVVAARGRDIFEELKIGAAPGVERYKVLEVWV
jgi:hypothetical protein